MIIIIDNIYYLLFIVSINYIQYVRNWKNETCNVLNYKKLRNICINHIKLLTYNVFSIAFMSVGHLFSKIIYKISPIKNIILKFLY